MDTTESAPTAYAWEGEYEKTWETVVEDESGSLRSTVLSLIEAGKRRRLFKDSTPVQRGIIRHVVILIDFSTAMSEIDLRPSRIDLTISHVQDFIVEFFEQNPISQMALIALKSGIAVKISNLGGNPYDHISALKQMAKNGLSGDLSLQNGFEMTRGYLYHVPSHGTREIIAVQGSLVSVDPGDIFRTVDALVAANIQVTIIGLAAQIALSQEICMRTNNGNSSNYQVVLNEAHFRELLLAKTVPPPIQTKHDVSSLMLMGFPVRVQEKSPSLCACHGLPREQCFKCPRCFSKVCSLPTECPTCSLSLLLSTHLARSYHHLFPLRTWSVVEQQQSHENSANADLIEEQMRSMDVAAQSVAALEGKPAQEAVTEVGSRPDTNTVSCSRATAVGSMNCFGCGRNFENCAKQEHQDYYASATMAANVVEQYQCPSCRHHFCIDCNIFAHEQLFECVGCQCR